MLPELRFVLLLVGLSLLDHRLIGPRVDLEQDVAGFDVLALGEGHTGDLAVHPRFHGHIHVGLDGAQAGDEDRQVLALGGAERHRHRLRARALRILRAAAGEEMPSAPGDCGDEDHDDPDACHASPGPARRPRPLRRRGAGRRRR